MRRLPGSNLLLALLGGFLILGTIAALVAWEASTRPAHVDATRLDRVRLYLYDTRSYERFMSGEPGHLGDHMLELTPTRLRMYFNSGFNRQEYFEMPHAAEDYNRLLELLNGARYSHWPESPSERDGYKLSIIVEGDNGHHGFADCDPGTLGGRGSDDDLQALITHIMNSYVHEVMGAIRRSNRPSTPVASHVYGALEHELLGWTPREQLRVDVRLEGFDSSPAEVAGTLRFASDCTGAWSMRGDTDRAVETLPSSAPIHWSLVGIGTYEAKLVPYEAGEEVVITVDLNGGTASWRRTTAAGTRTGNATYAVVSDPFAPDADAQD